ncbi:MULTISPECIES: TetR/AcrR family transcriptional regulator [Streptomyces]|uniref:TetR/AcrR family transcriptional regulator n=1 Tax=Streptomyces TaxID=1883 RepID=UPI0018ACE37F|nr:TetR/AcrR family transcriptional regulator [Streptomyces sp. BRB081]MBL3806565.1 TetR/AcrR family transcriptional regulator [Streptomyces sp. BRB081]
MSGLVNREPRSDAVRNRQAILAAADELFARADGRAVSTDDVAAAAGVGKGTIFRAFGDRAGLLDALFERRAEGLRAEIIEAEGRNLGEGPQARVSGILRAVVRFKVANLSLVRAIEDAAGRRGTQSLFDSPPYRAVYRVLTEQIDSLPGPADRRMSSSWAAHVLLSAVRVDLLDHLLGEQMSAAELEEAVDALAQRLLPT